MREATVVAHDDRSGTAIAGSGTVSGARSDDQRPVGWRAGRVRMRAPDNERPRWVPASDDNRASTSAPYLVSDADDERVTSTRASRASATKRRGTSTGPSTRRCTDRTGT